MTLSDIEREYRNRIAPEDFLVLAAHALDTTKESVMREPDMKLEGDTKANLRKLLDRRVQHEPVAYITGHREFYGLDFRVTPDTLIPRPETEHLIETILEEVHREQSEHPDDRIAIIDIGTGGGAIVVALAHALGNKTGISFIASDISESALMVAKENARRHGVADRITFLSGNVLEPFVEEASFRKANILFVTANLPYLSDERYLSAPPDVREYEPESALRADRGGLALYDELLRALAREHEQHLRPITAAFEIDPAQADPVRSLIQAVFPKAETDILPDLAGRSRVVRIRINLQP